VTGGFFDPVDGRDVRMIERGEHLRLALQAGEPFRIAGKSLGQDLQRHFALQPRVARPIHFSHAAGAERAPISYRPTRVPASSGMMFD
jgi:hypothetical protein